MKIVVVNENKLLVKLLDNFLSSSGYEVLSSADGHSCFGIIRSEKPDLVIIDLMISYVTGYELIEFIRNLEGKYIKIIVMTAVSLECVIESAFELGVDDYILLPLKKKELLARIERLSKYTIAI